ncbi:NmrA family NAD(P)-binding protein, partial [Paucibacter sp. XJ19-41]|uniref:NmrA family NAD(P)-binding protein n=1 Tax=Paucibacter sp. XJ19-41 TaxID=2927824 RepID=UPI00234B9DEE
RSAEGLAALAAAGAEPQIGRLQDAAYLRAAFEGADAAYVMLPHELDRPGFLQRQREDAEAIAAALHGAGVPHVVALSSLGAEQTEGTGVILGLHALELSLGGLPGLRLLRPGAFFENLLEQLPGLSAGAPLVDALRPDLAVPMLATRDIGDAAAAALLARDWQGLSVQELLGPCDLSGEQLACQLALQLGRPALVYQQLPYEVMAAELHEAGLAADAAALMMDMARALNEGRIRSLQGRNDGNSTPTGFAQFLREKLAP